MKPILINLQANEYIQGLHYYPSVVNLDRCTASSNTPKNTSGRICVPNKTEDVHLSVFDMITGIN